jgi:predicted SAM-dependent methyltransferase
MSQPANSFESTLYQETLVRHLKFEAKSLIGRLVRRRPVPLEKYLNLGCGPHVLDGFTNLDFFMFRRPVAGRMEHDLRYPLPFPDNQFAGVFSEHTLEHLYASEAVRLLGEVRRVLAPGGIFRCIVPDLGKFVRYYCGEKLEGFDEFENGCEAIWSLTQHYGHRSVWDVPMLSNRLNRAGFARIRPCNYREGADESLLVDQPHRRWASLYLEASK